ncbi:hypothetical protein A2774_05515 [Candidatus Roizmanbacteria bacterium RIFCSPHIGHO2_01_FULL_39_12c]|uniref:SpoVT-AbrB domain-containing protein n=1 Tax=Candidatus Roizmanbacteria bacterium RIFCSPHIGHO2_01_FULL_39_12c TaxID=1802031 RepID=A0A1F7GF09_9BACT|nr:MAG: hypothetical protein A2774_05515 [Candidatus Roizmanbacteria bacterium RIFCSPHIGHO2_01_FULL_39_12c]
MIGYSTVTQKGQITVPAAIRKNLGLHPNQKVIIIKQGDSAVVKSAANFYSLRGSIKPKKFPEDLKKMRKNFTDYLSGRKKV